MGRRRRGQDRKRAPTTAFGSHLGTMYANLRELYERGCKTLPKLELTSAELACLFTPKENHDILIRGHAVADLYANSELDAPIGLSHLPRMKISFRLTDNVLAPRNPALQMQDGNPEHIEKFIRVRDAYASLFVEYARCNIVLKQINNACTSPHQARFLWPGMVFLAKNTKFAEDLKTYRTPASVPTLPPGLRSACRDTSTTLAAFSLLHQSNDALPRIKIEGVYHDAELNDEYHA